MMGWSYFVYFFPTQMLLDMHLSSFSSLQQNCPSICFHFPSIGNPLMMPPSPIHRRGTGIAWTPNWTGWPTCFPSLRACSLAWTNSQSCVWAWATWKSRASSMVSPKAVCFIWVKVDRVSVTFDESEISCLSVSMSSEVFALGSFSQVSNWI